MNEFTEQKNNGLLDNIELIEDEVNNNNKKFIIKYKNLVSNKICQIVIGTVDSFMFTLGDKNNNSLNKFEGIVNSIINEHIETDNKGQIKYGVKLSLNKETLLIIDETQDLPINYLKAVIQIMRNQYIDSYIVGDKLQSITYEENSFTYDFNYQFSNIKIVCFDPSNICRRFYNKKLVDFVNCLVPFEKYSVPKIIPYKVDEIGLLENNDPVSIYEGKDVYNNSSKDVINEEVDEFMKRYKYEVEQKNRKPNSFLIITPFTTNNSLVQAIELAINTFWINKNQNTEKNNAYQIYVVFHKSEVGSSIDLRESENATRIVSIHSSKGDGRDVVFVIGVDEKSLLRFSGKKDSLVYDSLIHVAITRMKEKLYFRYINNNDDICRRLSEYSNTSDLYCVECNINIKNRVNYKKLNGLKTNKTYDTIYDNIILNKKDSLEYLNEDDNNNKNSTKETIDMGHHNIRYSTILISLLLLINCTENEKEDDTLRRQIYAILKNVFECPIKECDNWKDYNKHLAFNNKIYDEKSKKYERMYGNIPVLKLSNKGEEYLQYYDYIYQCMVIVKKKIDKLINQTEHTILCPFECILLNYMIGVTTEGTRTSIYITDLYNIVDSYSKSFNHTFEGHDNCSCKKIFNKPNTDNKKKQISDMSVYLQVHYQKMNSIISQYNFVKNKFPNINWLINHNLYFYGKNNNFEINRRFQLIGYNNTDVVIIYIKPQFNELNYNETLIDSVYDTFFLMNISQSNEENYKKFGKKNIKCVVFTTDRIEAYFIDWVDENNQNILLRNYVLLMNLLYESLINKYATENKEVFYYFKYWLKKKTEEEKTTPIEFLLFLKDKYDSIKNQNKNIPLYIYDFINKLLDTLSECKDNKTRKKTWKKYQEEEFFMEELNKRTDNELLRFLGINIEVEYSDTDSDSEE
jgi:hypothetical protein